MARTNNLTDFLTDVSNAIKQKTGDSAPIPASEFDTEILSIETAGNYQEKTLNITQNGNYNLLPDQEFDAISNVNISVSVSPVLQNKTITENGSYTADQNYDGLGTVIVNVQSSTINNQDKEINVNGTYTADEGYTGLGIVTVNVPQEGVDTSDATATVDDIRKDKTAYVNGVKITGNTQFAGVYDSVNNLPDNSYYYDTYAVVDPNKKDYPTKPGNYSDYSIFIYNGDTYLMQFDAIEPHKLYIQYNRYTWGRATYDPRVGIYYWKLNTANNTWDEYVLAGLSADSRGDMLVGTPMEQYIESTYQLFDLPDDSSDRPLLRDSLEKTLVLPELWHNNMGTWARALVNTAGGNRDASKLLTGYTMYAHNESIVGTMPNNGELNYTPSTEEQTIPIGYTSGGSISAIDITTLSDYSICNNLAEVILGISPYILLDYIESTGTQYINTGYKPTGNSQYELEITNSTSNGILFGAYNSTWTNGSGLYTNVGSGYNHWRHYASNVDTGHKSVASEHIIMNKGILTINNTTYLTSSTASFTVNRPLYIFAGNMGGNVEQPTKYRLHYFKISENDVLKHHFIPAIRISDNAICLYDLVTGQFFTNLGTGEFIAGGGRIICQQN